MSLHGIISVNNEVIGGWSAERLGPLDDVADDTLCSYRCTVNEFGPQGVNVTFDLTHRYGDGAFALAALVLTTFPLYTRHLDRHHGKPQ